MSLVCICRYSYVIRMSLVCTCMSFVCYLHLLLCHSYVARMYSYVIGMSFVCTRMSFVCHSYVLVCHSYVTRMYSFVIRVSLACTYVTCMSLVCGFTLTEILVFFLYWCQSLGIWYFGAALLSLHIFVRHVYSSNSFQNTFPKPRMRYAIKLGFHYGWDNMR